eukprot:CAMPEP_0117424530 /NCGR_PEP_ID=MMETSP0758-20121206/4925_1 /TAXON_ID=63605 /ORGANISM="Percolomonas cosmopolitus, Strain AE-1 (ATCC 50343)" /LENGTH=528 /DNA_ID=CAMNT_0005208353 /DNA_START=272 /DNA_END=1855 /DNA_ORIENTATION=+
MTSDLFVYNAIDSEWQIEEQFNKPAGVKFGVVDNMLLTTKIFIYTNGSGQYKAYSVDTQNLMWQEYAYTGRQHEGVGKKSVRVNDDWYFFGGGNKNVSALDTTNMIWGSIATVENDIIHHGVTLYDSQNIYISGGMVNGSISDKIVLFKRLTVEFEEFGHIDIPVMKHETVFYTTKLYIIGGIVQGNTYNDKLMYIDIETNQEDTITLTSAFASRALYYDFIQATIYVYGGIDNTQITDTLTKYALDSCVCITGYSGDTCEQPTCYGETGTTSCSNHGNCIGADNCICSNEYDVMPSCAKKHANCSFSILQYPQGASVDTPTSQKFSTIHLGNDEIILLGGGADLEENPITQFRRYSFLTNEWNSYTFSGVGASSPAVVNSQGLAFHSKFYILGGGKDVETVQIKRLDTDFSMLSDIGDLPPFIQFRVTQYMNYFVFTGGRFNGTIYEHHHIFEPDSMEWIPRPRLPTKIYGHTCDHHNDTLIFIGGKSNETNYVDMFVYHATTGLYDNMTLVNSTMYHAFGHESVKW